MPALFLCSEELITSMFELDNLFALFLHLNFSIFFLFHVGPSIYAAGFSLQSPTICFLLLIIYIAKIAKIQVSTWIPNTREQKMISRIKEQKQIILFCPWSLQFGTKTVGTCWNRHSNGVWMRKMNHQN